MVPPADSVAVAGAGAGAGAGADDNQCHQIPVAPTQPHVLGGNGQDHQIQRRARSARSYFAAADELLLKVGGGESSIRPAAAAGYHRRECCSLQPSCCRWFFLPTLFLDVDFDHL